MSEQVEWAMKCIVLHFMKIAVWEDVEGGRWSPGVGQHWSGMVGSEEEEMELVKVVGRRECDVVWGWIGGTNRWYHGIPMVQVPIPDTKHVMKVVGSRVAEVEGL